MSMHRAIIVALLLLASAVRAQQPPHAFKLGAIGVTEDSQSILLHTEPPVTVDVLPGGPTWPLLSLDEDGRIYVGSTIIDSSNGRILRSAPARAPVRLERPYGAYITPTVDGYTIGRGAARCRFTQRALGLNGGKTSFNALQHGNITLAASPNALLALVTEFAQDRDADYLAVNIDLKRCTLHRTRIGNSDLLVELNGSREGGWWITGSIEQTLLRSHDGRTWRKVALPPELHALISSYVANAREIWLAAYLDGIEDPGLVYSPDAGKTWQKVLPRDPVLDRLPVGWLEGQRRLPDAYRDQADAPE